MLGGITFSTTLARPRTGQRFVDRVGPETETETGRSIVSCFSFVSVLPVEQMRQMRLGAYLQPFRDPRQRHCRFFSQPTRDGQLPRIALKPCGQFGCRPLAPLQFLRHDPLGFRLGRFPQFLSVMPTASLGVYCRQQFLLERSVPKKPAPADWLVVVPILRRTPSLQCFLQSSPAPRAVFGYPILSQQPFYPQPTLPLARRHQVLPPTAPAKLAQWLLR